MLTDNTVPQNNLERMRERELQMRTKAQAQASANVQAQATRSATAAAGVSVCPNCGAENDPHALFCEQCGTKLREQKCPNCGEPLEDGCDYCEHCNTYIDREHCPFCHGAVEVGDTFCPTCGNSLSGVECPICHVVGQFAFCGNCGVPLTEEARQIQEMAWSNKALLERAETLEAELERLWLIRPVSSDRQRDKIEAIQQLRERVKALLASEGEDVCQPPVEGAADYEAPVMSAEDLHMQLLAKQQALQAILDSMEMAPQADPAYARNYAMARRPRVSRLAWRCNYKHALHPSPLVCACPQMGGKWILQGDKSALTQD